MPRKKAKKESSKVLAFFKNYPKSTKVFIILLLYQLIRIIIEPVQVRLVGLLIYFVIIALIINGSAKPALEYHFSKFEKSRKDQNAVWLFIVLYIVSLFVVSPISLIIYLYRTL